MAIEPVEFHHVYGSEGANTTAVRVLGLGGIQKFQPICEASGARPQIRDGDRLIGWLDVDLILADQEDLEGMNFDIVDIINS